MIQSAVGEEESRVGEEQLWVKQTDRSCTRGTERGEDRTLRNASRDRLNSKSGPVDAKHEDANIERQETG